MKTINGVHMAAPYRAYNHDMLESYTAGNVLLFQKV